MRSEPVPCVNATMWEIERNKHVTFNENAHCDPCRRLLEMWGAKRVEAEEWAMWEEEAEAEEYAIVKLGMDENGLPYDDYDPYDAEYQETYGETEYLEDTRPENRS